MAHLECQAHNQHIEDDQRHWNNFPACFRSYKQPKARKQRFTQRGRAISDVLFTHASCTHLAYQEGCIPVWSLLGHDGDCSSSASPLDWGWKKQAKGGQEIRWTTPLGATQTCREFIYCSCEKGCRRHCKCPKACLQCTALCFCGGLCSDYNHCIYSNMVILRHMDLDSIL